MASEVLQLCSKLEVYGILYPPKKKAYCKGLSSDQNKFEVQLAYLILHLYEEDGSVEP